MHLAASNAFRCADCARALLSGGARLCVTDRSGVTPRQLQPELVEEQRRLIYDALARIATSAFLSVIPQSSGDTSGDALSIGARFFKRLGSDYSKQKRSKDSASDYGPSTQNRDRTSSLTSARSRWSLNFRFSASPPPNSYREESMCEMEHSCRSSDPERVSFINFTFCIQSMCCICLEKFCYLFKPNRLLSICRVREATQSLLFD